MKVERLGSTSRLEAYKAALHRDLHSRGLGFRGLGGLGGLRVGVKSKDP